MPMKLFAKIRRDARAGGLSIRGLESGTRSVGRQSGRLYRILCPACVEAACEVVAAARDVQAGD